MENLIDVVDEIPFGVDIAALVVDEPMDDMQADACLQKIANWEKYGKFWNDWYSKKLEEVNEKCRNNIELQKRKLRYYYQSVAHRKTKTMEIADLPHGKLCMPFVKQKLVPDKEAILLRLKDSGENQFIKTKEELDWSGYKDRLFISDSGDVLDKETGEIITDVSIETVEGEFTVKAQSKESEET